MAKIRVNSVAGELGRYDYEVHYAAKEKLFEAKKHNTASDAFRHRSRILAQSEEALKVEFREAVRRYEATLNNWELYIIYKLSYSNGVVTGLSRQGHKPSVFKSRLTISVKLTALR